jgi:hypothetical protein
VNALATINTPATACLVLPTGYTLKAACLATMTAAKTLDIVCLGGDY